MKRYVEQRALLERQHRFVDIAYAEVIGDTMAAIERIYAAAGLPLTTEVRAAMTQWEAANPPGKHGKHSYNLEHFGLSEADVRSAFAEYLERFGNLI
jgi:hypothetical protein